MNFDWVELAVDNTGPIRIFKNKKAAVLSPAWNKGLVAEVPHAQAVESIRRKVFTRDNFTCINPACRKVLTWFTAEMHERVWRGRGGEVSTDNSFCICTACHRYDSVYGHGERRPRFGESVK